MTTSNHPRDRQSFNNRIVQNEEESKQIISRQTQSLQNQQQILSSQSNRDNNRARNNQQLRESSNSLIASNQFINNNQIQNNSQSNNTHYNHNNISVSGGGPLQNNALRSAARMQNNRQQISGGSSTSVNSQVGNNILISTNNSTNNNIIQNRNSNNPQGQQQPTIISSSNASNNLIRITTAQRQHHHQQQQPVVQQSSTSVLSSAQLQNNTQALVNNNRPLLRQTTNQSSNSQQNATNNTNAQERRPLNAQSQQSSSTSVTSQQQNIGQRRISNARPIQLQQSQINRANSTTNNNNRPTTSASATSQSSMSSNRSSRSGTLQQSSMTTSQNQSQRNNNNMNTNNNNDNTNNQDNPNDDHEDDEENRSVGSANIVVDLDRNRYDERTQQQIRQQQIRRRLYELQSLYGISAEEMIDLAAGTSQNRERQGYNNNSNRQGGGNAANRRARRQRRRQENANDADAQSSHSRSSQDLFGNLNPSNLRDTFELIERQRETAVALDQANENNSLSPHSQSSQSTARNLRAYDPLYNGGSGLYDIPRSMIEEDEEARNQLGYEAYGRGDEDDENEEEEDYYYEEVENHNGLRPFDYRAAADRLINYAAGVGGPYADDESNDNHGDDEDYEDHDRDDGTGDEEDEDDEEEDHHSIRNHLYTETAARQLLRARLANAAAARSASNRRRSNQNDDTGDDNYEQISEARQEEEDEENNRNNDDEDEDQDQEDEDDVEEDSEEYKSEETELERYLRDVQSNNQRARTAPLNAQQHIDQFKMTPGFTKLEQAAVCAVQLVQRSDLKFDLDSYEGQNSCKKFLYHIEQLCESVEVKVQNRSYRKKFSNAYKVLYKEGKLCYLTEILDSAQEAFPYLWVNGEKYVFSKEVIDAGRNLFNNFCKILYHVKDCYQRICEEQSYTNLADIINEMRDYLEEFDVNWATYEQLYVIELMLIESDARRFITEAIELEKEITSAEVRERAKGKIMVDCPDYQKNRGKLIEIINKINAVANPEGKGRDDLQTEIIFQAEGICRRVSSSQSKAVRKLAEAIRKSFMGIRQLLRKYEENIEGVDPQLKNNADLVSALVEFEQSWEKGKTYFVNPQKCSQLLHFTSMIEGTAEKYRSFQEQIEDRDTVIFVTIPALLILKNLDEDDKGICKMFFPPMFEDDAIAKEKEKEQTEDQNGRKSLGGSSQAHTMYQVLKKDYINFRAKSKNTYDFYNIVEKSVLEMEGEESNRINEESLKENGMCRNDLQKIVQQIRLLSMQLQRHKPADWNEFLDVALDSS